MPFLDHFFPKLKNFNKAYEIFFESGHNGIVCIRNGLAMYYALHTQQYEQALDLIYNFATKYLAADLKSLTQISPE